MRAELIALVVACAALLVGCSNELCIRNSDCGSGVCGPGGACLVTDTDAATDADADAETDDATDAPDDAGEDAVVEDAVVEDAVVDAFVPDTGTEPDTVTVFDDAGVDAATDSPDDAGADAVVASEPPIFVGPDRLTP